MTITLTLFQAILFAIILLSSLAVSAIWLVYGAKHNERRRITDKIVRRAEDSKNPAAAKEMLELVPVIFKQADTPDFWMSHYLKTYEKITLDFIRWNTSEGERYFQAGDYETAVMFFENALNTGDNPEYQKALGRAKAMNTFTWAQTELESGNWARARDYFSASQNYAKNAEFIIPEEAEFLKNLNASLAVVNLKKAAETVGLFSRYIAQAKDQATLAGISMDGEIEELYKQLPNPLLPCEDAPH